MEVVSPSSYVNVQSVFVESAYVTFFKRGF